MSSFVGGEARKVLAIDSQRLAHSPQRWSLHYRAIPPLVMASDVALIFLTCMLSTALYHYAIIGRVPGLTPYVSVATLAAVLFISIGKNGRAYELAELLNLKLQIRKAFAHWSAIFLLLAGLAFTIKLGENFSRGAIILFGFSGAAALVLSRVAWRLVLADGRSVRVFSYRQIAVISDQSSVSDDSILEALNRHGLHPSHRFVFPAEWSDDEATDVVQQAIATIRGSQIDELVVCADAARWARLTPLTPLFRALPLPVTFLPTGPSAELFRLPRQAVGETITIELQRAPQTLVSRAAKRLIDIVVSAAGLSLLLPLFVMTAAAIKTDSAGPVIFRQRRCGFNGRLFNIVKFRTMSVLEDGETIIQAQRNDGRITKIGTWLRRTSIDELPQLFNVLKGEMSIVGPRPHALAHDDQFAKLVANYAYRHHVKPGITGWAQVHGFRGETRTQDDLEQRIKLDLYYIDNWSLALDFKIIFMTLIEVFRGRNAY